MTIKIDRPPEVGEYDEGMQTLLQIVWGDGFLSPGGPEEVAACWKGRTSAAAVCLTSAAAWEGSTSCWSRHTVRPASSASIWSRSSWPRHGARRRGRIGQRIDLRVVTEGRCRSTAHV